MADIEYRFGTGESDPTVHHGQANVDADGNGTPDAIAVDFDGDGRYDDAMWDSDGDGVADTALLDHDNDGIAESAYADPTGEGTWNARAGDGETQPATDATPNDQTQDVPSDVPEDGGFENQPTEDNPVADFDPDAKAEGDDPFTTLDDDPADAGDLFDNLVPDESTEPSLSEWYSELET
ncbi:hypothetical protein [Actinokineospora sp.]|uniref:hypothetical protein n=1 Tax=Actinokineospora sp. TaxID=1872133 RepID=UPI0040382CEB